MTENRANCSSGTSRGERGGGGLCVMSEGDDGELLCEVGEWGGGGVWETKVDCGDVV